MGNLNKIEIKFQCFYDCGFDPRFSEDGKYYEQKPVQRNFKELISSIQELVSTILFTLNAYASRLKFWNPEEGQVRSLILTCHNLEKEFSDSALQGLVDPSDGMQCDRLVRSLSSYEHELFNHIGNLFKILRPQDDNPQRPFPSELLRPIHAINMPQDKAWGKDKRSEDGWKNSDLTRCNQGFYRLNEGMYSFQNDNNQPVTIDHQRYHYVPHGEFVEATLLSSDELKQACRSLRAALSEMTGEWGPAVSYERCKKRILPELDKLYTSWEKYTRSHELLKELQPILAEQDYYAPLHQERLLAVRQHTSSEQWEAYKKSQEPASGKSDKYCNDLEKKCRENLNFNIRDRFPQTKTGEMLKAHRAAKKSSVNG